MFDPGGGRPAEANGSFRRPLWGGREPDREENLSGESIPVNIYIPPCYDPYLQVYPVLFLLHGKPQDEGYWLQLGMDKSVDKGILEGESSPFIIVMPQQPEPLFTQTDGGRGLLEREIMQGLISLHSVSICDHRRRRTVGDCGHFTRRRLGVGNWFSICRIYSKRRCTQPCRNPIRCSCSSMPRQFRQGYSWAPGMLTPRAQRHKCWPRS